MDLNYTTVNDINKTESSMQRNNSLHNLKRKQKRTIQKSIIPNARATREANKVGRKKVASEVAEGAGASAAATFCTPEAAKTTITTMPKNSLIFNAASIGTEFSRESERERKCVEEWHKCQEEQKEKGLYRDKISG